MDTEVRIFHGGRNETPCKQPLSLFRYHGFITIWIVWTCPINELKICTTFLVVALLLNGGKSQNFQVKFLGLKKNQEFLLEIGNIIVKATRSAKLLGTTVDDELKFEKHVKALCQQVCKKLSASSRVAPYLDEKKMKILYHTFILSNFNYCPLIWMFCDKTQNKVIDRVHKRALRILFNDYTSRFEELLQKIGSESVHVNIYKI